MSEPVPHHSEPELNPTQVKQREHIGISAMVSGALFILAGIVVLFISWPAATMTLLLGIAILVAGGIVLARIPDLLNSPEEERT
ncbi:MAG: hypothetical protein AB8B93_07035 [Pseudomonadales bacterium]